MEADILMRLLKILQELALVTWVGGLVYICFVLPPLPDQRALPPLFVRLPALMTFRTFSAVCLGVLVVTLGIVPFFVGPPAATGVVALRVLRLVVFGACIVSLVQLYGFLNSAVVQDQAKPVPALAVEDPTNVDKVLRQINKVCRAMAFAGIALVVLTVMAG